MNYIYLQSLKNSSVITLTLVIADVAYKEIRNLCKDPAFGGGVKFQAN